MEMSTKLPAKWCIKCTKENLLSLGEWFNDHRQTRIKHNYTDYGFIGYYLHYPLITTVHSSRIVEPGYKEITIEKLLDKEQNFIPDQWYEIECYQHSYVLKVKSVKTTKDGISIESDSYAGKDSFGMTHASGLFVNPTLIRSLAVEEVQPYLTPEHPDKIVPKVTKWDAGTYVVKTAECSPNLDKMPLGTVGKIIRFHSDWVSLDIYERFMSESNVATAFKWFATEKEARAFAKEMIVVMPFGANSFTIFPKQGVVKCTEGTITKAEIEYFLLWLQTPPSILGYKFKTNRVIFGCKEGTLEEIEAIYKLL